MKKSIVLTLATTLVGICAYAEDSAPALDAAKANRFFRDLDGLTTGLDLRTGNTQADGSESAEAQAIDAITQPCALNTEETQGSRKDVLNGDVCPLTYERSATVLSATQTVNKIKLETKTTIKDEPALSLSTLREDNATSLITIAQAQQVVAFNVIETRTLTSTELSTVTMNRTLSVAQNAAGAQKVTIDVATQGGMALKAKVVISQDKDGNGGAECKLNEEAADCNQVAYLLGMVSDEAQNGGGSSHSNRQVPVIQPDRVLKMFIKK